MNTINNFILENVLLPISMLAWAVFMAGFTWSAAAGWVRQWREKRAQKDHPEGEAK